MMFTRTQLALLRNSALICGGFILGLAAMSPSINPFTSRDVDALEDTDTAELLNEREGVIDHHQAEPGRQPVGSIDCSDLDSPTCLDLRESYQRYLSGNWGRQDEESRGADRHQVEVANNERRLRQPYVDNDHTKLRVVTVFNGPVAREFVVPREMN